MREILGIQVSVRIKSGRFFFCLRYHKKLKNPDFKRRFMEAKMKALKLVDQHQTVLTEVTQPKAGKGEVVLAVTYCGICRTDRKAYLEGQRDLVLPRILGHEFSGIILETGEGVTDYQVGDKVSLHPGIGCGTCDHCLEGNDQRCHDMRIFGFHLDGGFSPYCVIPEAGVKQGILRKIPKGVSMKTAALAEPIGCALHMLETLDIQAGEHILIAGAGVMGIMTALLARYFGAKPFIYDPVEEKCIPAEKMGLTVIDVDAIADGSITKDMAPFDAAVPCCPYSSEIAVALERLKKGGRLGFFSGLIEDGALTKDVFNLIHYKELTVRGTYGVGAKDTMKALKLLESGFKLPDSLITTVDISEVEDILKCRELEKQSVAMIDFGVEGAEDGSCESH